MNMEGDMEGNMELDMDMELELEDSFDEATLRKLSRFADSFRSNSALRDAVARAVPTSTVTRLPRCELARCKRARALHLA